MSQPQPTFVPILGSQLGGAITVNIFSLLSTIALISVILRITWLAVRRRWCKSLSDEAQESVFFHTQLGNYASCLIIALMFTTISGIIGFQWLFHRGVTDGWTCRFQALIMQIGTFSTGYFTIAIAVHTFNSLVMKMRQSVVICRTTIVAGWVLAAIIAAVPFMIHLPEGYVYGADDLLTCGVRSVYPKLQFFLHLLPILLASVLGAVLYSLIFLVLRGTLKLKSGIKLTLDPSVRWNGSEGLGESYHRFIARVARSMLWYPVAYVAFLIPYAVTRLFIISGFAVPFQAAVFAHVCWFSLSVVDVLLLYNTFRILGPAFDACSAASTRKTESFSASGNLEKYAPSPLLSQRPDMKEKIHQYRSQGINSPRPSHDRSISGSSSSSNSTRQLLPLYLGQDGVNDRNSSASVIGRPITPGFNYQRDVVQPAPAASLPRQTGRELASPSHSRSESLASVGLPAPPRRTRSPLLNLPIPEPTQSPRRVDDEVLTEQWLSHQRSTQTFGHQDSPSANSPSLYSEDGEASPSEWSSRSLGQGVHPQTASGQPMLSAVTSALPMYVSPRSPPHSATLERTLSAYGSAPSPPPKGHRPLLLSHAARSSSVSSPTLRNP